MDQVSSKGYAMGYIGGGLLLAINLFMILFLPEILGVDPGLMTRMTFVTVAIWWFVFTLPLLLVVREPGRRILPGEELINPLQASFRRLRTTFHEIQQFKDLATAMLAFWIYANGIGTIIVMATAYGTELGFGQTTLIGTLLMVQFLAAPFAFLFGWLAKRMGTIKSIYICLSVYTVISILGYFMYQEWQFYLLGALVATVQGGSQALSRSLVAKMIPLSKSAEFFGFFSVFEKFSSILGPLIFGVVSTLMGNSRLSIVSLILFFAIGVIVLSRVNLNRGIHTASLYEQGLTKP
jgi:UMF1 family MFS transporter